MSFFIRNIIQHAVRKIAADPVVRDKAANAARKTADEASKIMRDEDPSRAAGRAFSQALRKFGLK